MQQYIHGSAISHANVELFNKNGDVLAKGQTDASGKWGANAEVAVGDEVKVIVNAAGCRVKHSEWIKIEANPPVLEEQQASPSNDEDAEARKKLESTYVEVVCALADGKQVDGEGMPELLATLNLDWDDVERDVAALQLVSAAPSLECIY